jgi:hypothetical protein
MSASMRGEAREKKPKPLTKKERKERRKKRKLAKLHKQRIE